MAVTKLPAASAVNDQQFVQVKGPDQLVSGFVYDQQTRTFYAKEAQAILPSLHGLSHIGEDPIPGATCDTPGLLTADDKCKLDSLVQTRFGILGFSGAGFPNDGGYMQGDILLTAGNEFLSIERIGNVIRFNVDIPFTNQCACEACAQIYWIQDETEVAAIRPPSCGGKLPGVNGYGELKFYLLPESTIIDPSNPQTILNSKGQYPSLIFKRYDDSIAPGLGEFELVLKRDANNQTSTEVGWAMTPGAGVVPECVWFMGNDSDGNRIRFDLKPETEPGLLGMLVYKGHLLTKRMAVVTNYTPQLLTTNQYICKWWDVVAEAPIGDEFTARNIWRYENPENQSSGSDPKVMVQDRTISLLEIGTLIDIWFFQIGEVAATPIRRYYINHRPPLRGQDIWPEVATVEFGSTLTARAELMPSNTDSTDKSSFELIGDHRNFERTIWGLTGYDTPLLLFEDAESHGPTSATDFHDQHRARIDDTLPGLVVDQALDATEPFSERPVHLWHRTGLTNLLATMLLGRPALDHFPPYDVLLNAPIDNHDNLFLKVSGKGAFIDAPGHWVIVKGAHFRDLPRTGAVRLLTGSRNKVWNYSSKLVYPHIDDDGIVLAGLDDFPDEAGTIVELLHQEYNSPVVRVEANVSGDTIELQFKVGILDMSLPYEGETLGDDVDDYVRGLAPGYTVSSIYTQEGTFSGVGTLPSTNVDGFLVYDGGAVGGGEQAEYWNELEIMQRDGQLWIWWNGLLIPPNASLSASLDSPVTVTTPYFPLNLPSPNGKFGLRLWPGSSVRRVTLRSQSRVYNEYTRGQVLFS